MLLKQKLGPTTTASTTTTLPPYGSCSGFYNKEALWWSTKRNTRDNSESNTSTKMLNRNIQQLFCPQYNKLMNWEENLIWIVRVNRKLIQKISRRGNEKHKVSIGWFADIAASRLY